MWQDGGNRDKCRPFQDRLKKIMAIELPKEDFEKVSDADKKALSDKTDSAEKQMDDLNKVSSILLKIFASNEEWEKYWKERMDLNQKVMLSFKLQKHLCR